MLLILSSKGAETLLMGPVLEKPERAIKRITNVRRAGWVGLLGSELEGYRVTARIDANSCFPQRPTDGKDRD